MFEIGFWELALIAVLGLVVLGPEKLPKVATQLGRYAGQARRMARTLTAQIRDELEAEERRIMAKESRPVPPAAPVYNRPGAEDLVPGRTAEAAAPAPPAEDAPPRGNPVIRALNGGAAAAWQATTSSTTTSRSCPKPA